MRFSGNENLPFLHRLRMKKEVWEPDAFFDQVVERTGVIDAESRQAFVRAFRKQTIAAGDHFFRAGETPTEIFVISCGLVRLYYVTDQGRFFNKSLVVAGEVVGSLASFTRKAPCRFSAEALEETTGFSISTQALQDLYCKYPAISAIGRVFAEELAVKKELREAELLLDSPERRYCRLLDERPELAKVPLYHIAAYLGVTDVALSRIRRRLKKAGKL